MATGNYLENLETTIGYSFKDKLLLKQALTHSSYANEQKIRKNKDYERLEFLGDAVLELVTSEFLFHENSQMPEGKLTKMRSSLVCEPSLAACAKVIGLGDFLFLGKGEEATGGRFRESIISDVMEALIGALYLDGGILTAKEFIYSFVLKDYQNRILFYDSKTVLQEMIQTKPNQNLVYDLLEEKGPDHDKEFVVQALLNGNKIGYGVGKTKKAAEQQAAYEAILFIKKKEEFQ
ncbi:MAG: ribonuclease III [Lachnospiraceae bacterium]|nr:ribonuclease III [Lachnospiraceae bacterium]